MKYVVFSDIHSNYEALLKFKAETAELAGATFICLGDIAGYSASPNECIEVVREMDIVSIHGNHDYYICREEVPLMFNSTAAAATKWQISQITDENKEWLSILPSEHIEEISFGRILFVHGSPVDNFSYITHSIDARKAILKMMERGVAICFIAHTHAPFAWIYRGIREVDAVNKCFSASGAAECDMPEILRSIEDSERAFSDMNIKLRRNDMAIINAGSVGQPRDGDPRGCYVVFDSAELSVEFFRFDYPVKEAQDKIIAAGLPERLSSRLADGA